MRLLPLLWLFSILASASPANGAVLSIANQSAAAGQSIPVPVIFSSAGDRLSGVQFDLTWDSGIDIQVAFGQDLPATGKLIYARRIATNSIRVLIVGADQNQVNDGEMARLFVSIGSAARDPQ